MNPQARFCLIESDGICSRYVQSWHVDFDASSNHKTHSAKAGTPFLGLAFAASCATEPKAAAKQKI
jgi:hypothetical protein